MECLISSFWETRFTHLKSKLESNRFEVFIAHSKEEAKEVFFNEIFSTIKILTVARGGSTSIVDLGIDEILKNEKSIEYFNPFDTGITAEKRIELEKKGLLVDLFISGANAVTENGQIVNRGMIGNRIAPISFGPQYVVLFVGRNKIVPDLDYAMNKIQTYTAPINARRLNMKTPCVKSSLCSHCQSMDRICNSWLITEKCYPAKRIKIILIAEDVGF